MISGTTDLSVIINVCLGAAIALGMSGASSAYVSEATERERALGKLEKSMIKDLHASAHGEAAPEIRKFENSGFRPARDLLEIGPEWRVLRRPRELDAEVETAQETENLGAGGSETGRGPARASREIPGAGGVGRQNFRSSDFQRADALESSVSGRNRPRTAAD